MKKIKTAIPLWDRDLYIIVGGDFNDTLKIAKENKLSESVINEITSESLTSKNALGGAYFCLEKGIGIAWFPSKRIIPGILAHEATHIVDWLLEFVGAEKEMEARAYTVEWLVTNIPLLIKKV